MYKEGNFKGRDNGVFDEEFEKGGISQTIENFAKDSGIYKFGGDEKIAKDKDPLTNPVDWRCAVMLLISFVLLFLAIVKKFEPLLLMPIAFGMLLTNLPGALTIHIPFLATVSPCFPTLISVPYAPDFQPRGQSFTMCQYT